MTGLAWISLPLAREKAAVFWAAAVPTNTPSMKNLLPWLLRRLTAT